MNKLLNVKCPNCATVFSYYESANRPFCSEKCKQIDLGHWFKESYVVPVKEFVQTGMKNEENESEKDDEKNGQNKYEKSYEESYEENYKEDYNESDYN